MVASQKRDALGISGLVAQQQLERLHAVVPPIHKVALARRIQSWTGISVGKVSIRCSRGGVEDHEDVVCRGDLASLAKQLEQVIKLSVHVPAFGGRLVEAVPRARTKRTHGFYGTNVWGWSGPHPQTVTGLCTGCTFDSSINISFT